MHRAAGDRVQECADETAVDDADRIVGGLVRGAAEDHVPVADMADPEVEVGGDRWGWHSPVPHRQQEITTRHGLPHGRDGHRVVPDEGLAARLAPGDIRWAWLGCRHGPTV